MKFYKKVYKTKKLYNVSFCSQLGQSLSIPDNTWRYLVILGDTWQYFYNTKQYLPILNNSYQFLTIPNNTWQTWYWLVSAGIAKASSIAANTIPVLWRYRHDTVLTVFCLSGIVTVPILAIFTKPLTLSHTKRYTFYDLNEITWKLEIV
jgi:hypothetical protein